MNDLKGNNSPKLSQYIRKYLIDIGEKEGFTDCSLIEHTDGSDNNDGNVADIFRVSLHGIERGLKCELKLICKILKTSRADVGPLSFVREAYVYQNVLEDFQKFQKRHGISDANEFNNFPKCYGAVANTDTNQHFIVLEDLQPSGYFMANRLISMDFEHVKELIQTLGRLHAVSFAMKEKEPELFDKFKNLHDQFGSQIRDLKNIQEAFKYSFNKAIAAFGSDKVKEIQIITYLRDNFLDVLHTLTNSQQDNKYNVLIHGDIWVNNVLFAKDVENKLKSCLIDFQMTRYCSPATDLTYLLFTSTEKKFRDVHYTDVIKLYHESLSNTLHEFGCEAKKLFSFDDLLDQMKKFGKLAIIYAPLLLQVVTATKNNPDIVSNFLELLDDEASLEQYNERIRDVFEDGIKYGYI